ncbi:M20/M25/M40 family metallo-hydrolase [Mesorhizobium sp. WSM3224]|uniref:M20 family metallopeptidase n=1 Tax=Mesorhizobium sp. WSM3224 TaxID=1040986 RepID=UPI0003F6D037|nr:M20/M25/M40 family metallo-hydrolase [Mesorhizobium sp. WSM3224]
MIDQSLVARLKASFDRDEAISLLQRSVGCPSITGDEAAYAALLADEMRAIGAERVTMRDFEPGRPNVWGTRRGREGGMRLLVIGHTDTVHVRSWRDRWIGTERENPFGAAIVDGAIWGRGTSDMKAGICTALSAVRTLDRAGILPDPTITFAFIGDEESGEVGSGISAGVRAFSELLANGEVERQDFAIYAEPTMLNICPAHMGFFIADVKVVGRPAYFGVPELGVDALKATHAMLSAIWQYSEQFKIKPAHPLIGHGFVLVTSINGGGSIAVPGECTFSYICKVPPGDSLDAIQSDIEAAVSRAIQDPEVTVAFSYPTRRDHAIGGTPFESPSNIEPVRQLMETVKAVRPDRGEIEAIPGWSELPFLSAVGIPGVYWAPGDVRVCHTPDENVNLQDYLDGVIAFAAYLAGAASRA